MPNRGGSRICQGALHDEHRVRAYIITGVWEQSGGVHFHTKEGLKVKELSDSSLQCPRPTASHSHDQPLLLVIGGRLPGLPSKTKSNSRDVVSLNKK